MTVYHINVRLYVHRCPAEPDRHHVIDRRQTVMATTLGGPCHRPLMVQGTKQPCSAIAIPERQCRACRTQVIVDKTETIDLGFQGAALCIAEGYADEVQP